MNKSFSTNGKGCLFCNTPLRNTVVDLGMSPLCESYVSSEQLNAMEPFYPLHVYVCDNCFLVQLNEYVHPQRIFSEYAYFSSYSDTWVQHARDYVEMIVKRLRLNANSLIVELASNDGYLLQHVVAKGIPALGIEPAANVAKVAEEKGVRTLVDFFTEEFAWRLVQDHMKADLIIGNNVLAQVPDLNDFVEGIRVLLKSHGVATLEFPHVMKLIEQNQFDTIYHEHFSYFSLLTVERIFASRGLTLFDVEELPTHGGSLRIYARHAGNTSLPLTSRFADLKNRELSAGVNQMQYYATFSEKVKETKRQLLRFLIGAKQEGKSVVGYGAPGKGNTLLNYCGIRSDCLEFTVDRSKYKQGKFLPGTHIPIYHPDKISEVKPDYVLILPWNFKDEIMKQMDYIRDWGGKFVIPIPLTRVVNEAGN